MNIKLDDSYTITADSKQYMLQKRNIVKDGERQGESNFVTVGYYPKLTQVLKAYKELNIRSCDATTMSQVYEMIKNIDKKIDEVLKDN